jgi:hypothetical protein
MCGDLEEHDQQERLEDQLMARFMYNARSLLSAAPAGEGLHGYMDKLFAEALAHATRDAQAADSGKQYERLAAQALVYVRLAGFLSGHVALHEDPLRQAMEAMMTGYSEPETIPPPHDHGHHHGHDHGHHHGGDHHHGDDHHH